MKNLIGSHSKKVGLPPGSLVYVGTRKAEKTKIRILDYDETQFQEKDVVNVQECFPFRDKNTTTWIHVIGLHEPEIMESIGRHYNIHHLILEDILNTKQRPKMEEYEDCLFIVLKIFYYAEKDTELSAEQLSLVLGSNFVLLFQEEGQDIFEPVRKRIKANRGRIRKMGADYLCYALMDTAIDHYFTVIETMDDRMESVEELLADPSQETLNAIHQLRHEMIFLRKAMLPIRELITNLKKTDCPLVNDVTRIYLRDLSDHTIRIIDTIEAFR
jgi:magnesium transporter